MDQVFVFDKSLHERLGEYMDMFPKEPLPVSQMKKEWSFYLELIVDPNGWQAVWKIPRLICECHKVHYPTIVLVYVESVNFTELTAVVKILAVQGDDVHLPDKHTVQLVQLWPTKEQDDTVGLNITSTANALDMLRFFYSNILMPWDYEDDDENWIGKHLETRLHLHYDMRNGVIPRQTAEYLSSLISEAKRLQAKYEAIEEKLEDTDSDCFSEHNESESLHNLMCIQVRILQIRNEIELLENPLMRKTLFQMEKESKKLNKEESENWLVYPEGKISDCLQFLKDAEVKVGEKPLKFSVSLMFALDNASANSKFILNPTKHEMRSTGTLEAGGALLGLYKRDETVIFSKNDDIMLDCNGDSTVIENVTLDASCSQYAVVVRRGKVVMKNCTIIGNFESSTQQGIIVLSGNTLELHECEISGFNIAIVGNSGSMVVLKNCNVYSVNVGLKVFEKCKLLADKVNFNDCSEYGICLEAERLEHTIGGFSILEGISDMEIRNLSGKNNGKGDAVIHQKTKIKPFRDLFSNPELDPTIIHNTTVLDDEMDTSDQEFNGFNDTVIENDLFVKQAPPVESI